MKSAEQPFGAGDRTTIALDKSGKCFQLLLLLLNLGLLIGSVAFFTKVVDWYNERNWLAVCQPCKSVVVFLLVVDIFLLLTSLVGVLRSYTRTAVLSLIYGFSTIVLFFTFLAWFILLMVAYGGFFDKYVEAGWNDDVANDPNTICGLETELRCTGWNFPCTNLTAPPPGCTICVHPNSTDFLRTCQTIIRNNFYDAFLPLLLIGVVGVIVTTILVCVTWMTRKQYDYEPV